MALVANHQIPLQNAFVVLSKISRENILGTSAKWERQMNKMPN